MCRKLLKLALGITVAFLSLPFDVMAGRGGGYRGGGYGGGGRGGYGGQMRGGSMGHSPAMSQYHPPSGSSGSYGNRSAYGNQGASNHNAGAAAAGAGYANHNQSSQYPHAGAAGAAAGAGYSNRNQSSQYPHAGAAGAAAGAGYANNHNGTWNGNSYAGWGATGLGMGYPSGVGAWGVGSPMYGWGYSGYSNPYYGGGYGSGGVVQAANVQQPTAAQGSDYSQPISTTAAPPDQAVSNQAASAYDQASAVFKSGDYAQAVLLDQQALAQTPNDTNMHEFLGLAYFAQGKYSEAAAPLYAVLSVRPGWDWTTLSGMYPDVATYTSQLRALEAYVRSNPDSAQARFVLAYQYLAQGHDPEAVTQLKEVVRLQPSDKISAQIIAAFQPSGNGAPAPAEAAPATTPAFEAKLAGTWAATPSPGAKVALSIQDDGTFTWTASNSGKPTTHIAGKSTLALDILTLSAQGGQNGALVGRIAWQDAGNFTFRVVGGPSNDPGLKFAR